MNRTTAIIVTIVTALACGVPSLVLMCLGALALFGAQLPEVMAQNPGSTQQDVMVGSVMFLCVGAVLLVIPLLVGFFSFRLSKKEESANQIDYIPPAS
jgi:hypothetical protein